MVDYCGVKVLFLAKYAPVDLNSLIPSGIEDYIYAEYHHDIYRILSSSFEKVYSFTNVNQLIHNRPDIDYVFSLYNRMNFHNSEIFVSSVCEYYGIPYLGARPNIRAVAEDKNLAKICASHLGISTPEWCTSNVGERIPQLVFEGPYFVKPRYGASSLNIDEKSFCAEKKDVYERIEEYHRRGFDVIIEKYISGTSITVPIINNYGCPIVFPLVVEKSNSPYNIITYKQKRKIVSGLNRIVNTDDVLQKEIQYIALKLFHSVQPLDYTRIDFIIDENSNIPYFIEFNVCCNLGKQSAINISANSVGISHEKLINNITLSSMYRQHLINIPINKL